MINIVTEQIFNYIFDFFRSIREVFELIKLSIGGVTINLWQFSLAIIIFGVLMGLFINYTKKEAPSDMVDNRHYYRHEKNKAEKAKKRRR